MSRGGPMTGRGVRLTDEQWSRVELEARERNVTVGDVIREAVTARMSADVKPPPRITEHYVAGWLEGFGEKLRLTRQQRGTSLRALGEKLELRADVLHHIEHGRMMPNSREIELIRAWINDG